MGRSGRVFDQGQAGHHRQQRKTYGPADPAPRSTNTHHGFLPVRGFPLYILYKLATSPYRRSEFLFKGGLLATKGERSRSVFCLCWHFVGQVLEWAP